MKGARAAESEALVGRLRGRRTEIERSILAGVHAVTDLSEAAGADYVRGLEGAVCAAVDYALVALEQSEGHPPPVPAELLAQARLAARNGVSLETVIRRYFAGFALLSDFLMQEVQEGAVESSDLQHLMAALSGVLDRLVAAVSDEHARAGGGSSGAIEERRASQARRLLAGEPPGVADFSYDFDAHHLGLVAQGPEAVEAIRELAIVLDRRPLIVSVGEARWAWLGSMKATDPIELREYTRRNWAPQLRLAIGEPAEGLEGWRLTHRQARAAFAVAQRGSERIVRYGDVTILAAVLRDELLVQSLRQLYLDPLARERDGGKALRETLRAYFAADRNVSSTAAALGVTRHTVSNRLRAVEDRMGSPLHELGPEIEIALSVEQLDQNTVQRAG